MTSITTTKHATRFQLGDGRELLVQQDTSQVDGLGGEVWAGAFVLSQFLELHASSLIKDRHVLELGAGCGLCGLTAAALGASRVVLTDEFPDLLAGNVALNNHLWSSKSVEISTAALEWGDEAAVERFRQRFDLVMGSEVTQLGRGLHAPLLQTVRWALRQSREALALLSMDPCSAGCEGKCRVDKCTASHFAAEAERMGFRVVKHASVQLVGCAPVVETVGALGRPLRLDADDLSAVFELRLAMD